MRRAILVIVGIALCTATALATPITRPVAVKSPSLSVCQQLHDVPNQVQAVITAEKTAKLSSQISAYIDAIPFKEGDSFSKGDVLVQFDCSLQQSELQKAMAQLTFAKTAYLANKRLRRYNGISETEYIESEAKYQDATAEVASKSHIVKLCTIKAPYAGTVVNLNVHAHETVAQNEVLLEILNNSSLQIEFIVPSKWLSWLRTGTKFNLCVSEQQRSYPGQVLKVVPQIDAISQSIKIIGQLDNPSKALIAGMSGKAVFEH